MKSISALIVTVFLLVISASFATAADKTPSAQAAATASIHEPVNINTADVETLAQLKGVGSKKAQAIVAWRDANGGFTSIEQLLEVKGIGEATLEANREKL